MRGGPEARSLSLHLREPIAKALDAAVADASERIRERAAWAVPVAARGRSPRCSNGGLEGLTAR